MFGCSFWFSFSEHLPLLILYCTSRQCTHEEFILEFILNISFSLINSQHLVSSGSPFSWRAVSPCSTLLTKQSLIHFSTNFVKKTFSCFIYYLLLDNSCIFSSVVQNTTSGAAKYILNETEEINWSMFLTDVPSTTWLSCYTTPHVIVWQNLLFLSGEQTNTQNPFSQCVKICKEKKLMDLKVFLGTSYTQLQLL